jgi:hypothetical protein
MTPQTRVRHGVAECHLPDGGQPTLQPDEDPGIAEQHQQPDVSRRHRQTAEVVGEVLIYPGKSQLIQPVADSPPAFMAAGFEDRPDISTGLAEAYLRFKKAGVQAELHIYAKTGHGCGICLERAGQSHQEWPVQLVSFLRQLGMIK